MSLEGSPFGSTVCYCTLGIPFFDPDFLIGNDISAIWSRFL